MKRVIALLLALSLVFAFAACKKTDKEDETKAPETEIVTNEDGEEVVVPAEDETEAEEVTNEDGEAVTDAEEATEAEAATKADGKPDTNKPDANKPAAQKGLNSTNPAEVAKFYVAARNKSMSPAPKGHQKMVLAGELAADGGVVGTLLPKVKPIINDALSNNSVETNFIPAGGYSDLKGSDITSCSAKVQGNYTIVNIKLKNQVDGSNGNKTNGGAVSRGIGTLGSIDEALNELKGIELKSGRETVKLTYTDAYFKAKIDNNTGKIVGGTYHYLVKLSISQCKIKLGPVGVSVNDLKANIDYTINI